MDRWAEGRALGPTGHTLREAQVWQWVVKAPAREGWGEWDGQTDGHSLISHPDPPLPHHPLPPSPISPCRFLSAFLSANQSFLKPRREKWEKKTEMGEKDEGPCVCLYVCVSSTRAGWTFRREGMKGAEDEQKDQQQIGGRGAAWKDQEHTSFITHHIPHTPHTHYTHWKCNWWEGGQ